MEIQRSAKKKTAKKKTAKKKVRSSHARHAWYLYVSTLDDKQADEMADKALEYLTLAPHHLMKSTTSDEMEFVYKRLEMFSEILELLDIREVNKHGRYLSV